MRQIVLDTETTGLEPSEGHRIIEIGCVELQNRRATGEVFHRYINPERDIDEGAIEVHGITLEQLKNEPTFAEIADEFLKFVSGAELVIHNAPFDVGFINHELRLLGGELGAIESRCSILDTLALARRMHPGQKNNLDALTKRYEIDHHQRELHGALLDAQILADVYLAMTGGQARLGLDGNQGADEHGGQREVEHRPARRPADGFRVLAASADEQRQHEARLDEIAERAQRCQWRDGG